MNKKNIVDNSMFFKEIYKKSDFFKLKYSVPSVITSENNSNFYVKIITCGTSIEDFSIRTENNTLIINCMNRPEEDSKIYTNDLKSFEKTLKIPDNSDINNMEGRLFNGIFTLTIPKSYCFYD